MRPQQRTHLGTASTLALTTLGILSLLLPGALWGVEEKEAASGTAHGASSHARTEPNHLGGESSPYLLLHQYNPVDWYPWGEEALRKAKDEDKPIFLSVGYSTCYWCHVMERESFSDLAIAEILNQHFVPIKVDREERPDLDEIYMTATQLFTRRGGWPNSVFLTPELKPFYAGTYFPPNDRQGRPGFSTLLTALSSAWKEKRSEIDTQAQRMAETMGTLLEQNAEPAQTVPPGAVATTAIDSLAGRFDSTWGGFGSAPKFPSPANLFLLADSLGKHPRAEEMLRLTLDRMARGGMYDHAGGGFHRYSVDAYWRVPHFEKMLYDNGALMEIYALWYAHSGDPWAEQVLRETAQFLHRDLSSPEGAFWSAIDAETNAHEGAFYVWTREEIKTLLGEKQATFLAPIYGFDDKPTFEGSHYVLWLPKPLQEQAAENGLSRADLLARTRPLLDRLLAARGKRDRPLTDDKVLTSWNGLAIAGLATAGQALDEPLFIQRAAKAARFLWREMRPEGKALQHSWRQGQAKIDAYLEDYAYFIHGLLALHRATGEQEWLHKATLLSAEQKRRLAAPKGGFYVAAENPELLFRSREYTDNARQSPNAMAVLNALYLAEISGKESYRRQAETALKAFAKGLLDTPEAARTLALAAQRYQRIVDPSGQAQSAANGSATAQQSSNPLDRLARSVVDIGATLGTATPTGAHPLTVSLQIQEGWHINANPATDEFLIPTQLKTSQGELQDLDYPKPEFRSFSFSEKIIAVYEGEVEIEAKLATKDARVPQAGTLQLTYQACDDQRCLRPVTVDLKPMSSEPRKP
jgi:uncharacterized protein YyaL (SSP411 family)